MYENLPIYRSALALAVYMEQIVRGFEKYHKYTMGVDLRQKSKTLLFLIGRANLSSDKTQVLLQLRDACEEMKMLLQLAKELKTFKNFKQFEHSSLLAVTVCKQAQAWLQASKKKLGGGVARSSILRQSLQILSAKRATFTVRPFCQSA